jgi:hypothetical protein
MCARAESGKHPFNIAFYVVGEWDSQHRSFLQLGISRQNKILILYNQSNFISIPVRSTSFTKGLSFSSSDEGMA